MSVVLVVGRDYLRQTPEATPLPSPSRPQETARTDIIVSSHYSGCHINGILYTSLVGMIYG